MKLIEEFNKWIEETDKGLYDGGWNFGDNDYKLFNKIKLTIIENQEKAKIYDKYKIIFDLAHDPDLIVMKQHELEQENTQLKEIVERLEKRMESCTKNIATLSKPENRSYEKRRDYEFWLREGLSAIRGITIIEECEK